MSEEIEVLIRTQFFKERRGNGQRSRIPASRGHAADSSGIQISMTGQGPLQKDDRPPGYDFKNGAWYRSRDCDYWHSPHCRGFRRNQCKRGKDCPTCRYPQFKSSSKTRVRKAENMRLRNRVQPLAITHVARERPENLTLRGTSLSKEKETMSAVANCSTKQSDPEIYD